MNTKHTPDHYAVIGNPVEQSFSPWLHHQFAKQTGENMVYEKILAPLDSFAQVIKAFAKEGGCGVNVTVPFKQQAYELVHNLSERAQQAKAVNTIVFNPHPQAGNGINSWYGDNTDGVGLVRDITINHQMPMQDKTILIIGAGGAVRGVLGPILAQRPKQLIMSNRTIEKAQQLVKEFDEEKILKALSFAELEGQKFDIIINGTSASLQNKVPNIPVSILLSNPYCYDMAYKIGDTAFVAWAKQHGINQRHDGIGMLVEQGAEAFYIWRGVRPETQSVINALREFINKQHE